MHDATAPFLDLLRSHRSIRQFKPDPIPTEHLRAAIAAGQTASTSAAVQAYSVLRVTDPAKRALLAELTGPQEKVRLAPEFLVFCADTRRHRLAAQRAGHPYDARLEAFLVAVIDTALLAEKTVIALEAMGYGICYIGGLRNRLRDVDELLHMPQGLYPLFGLCVGKPDQEPGPRPRLPVEAVLHEDRFPVDDDVLPALDAYDRAYAEYLRERSTEPKAWTQTMSARFVRPERADLADYYREKGARLD